MSACSSSTSCDRRAACASTASPPSTPDDPLLASYEGAQLIVRVRATCVFRNCPRYIHRMELVERSRHIPRANHEPPIPAWKTTRGRRAC